MPNEENQNQQEPSQNNQPEREPVEQNLEPQYYRDAEERDSDRMING